MLYSEQISFVKTSMKQLISVTPKWVASWKCSTLSANVEEVLINPPLPSLHFHCALLRYPNPLFSSVRDHIPYTILRACLAAYHAKGLEKITAKEILEGFLFEIAGVLGGVYSNISMHFINVPSLGL